MARGVLRTGRRPAGTGQALAEFALVLVPLLLILLGIIQMGLVFNAQVTITNAVREGARTATIYVYDSNSHSHSSFDGTPSANDLARADAALAALKSSMVILSTNAPQLTTSGSWTSSGTAPNLTYTNGDVTVSYNLGSATDSDARTGQQVTVSLVYHEDLLIPMIANLLPRDAGGRLAQRATVTMVIN